MKTMSEVTRINGWCKVMKTFTRACCITAIFLLLRTTCLGGCGIYGSLSWLPAPAGTTYVLEESVSSIDLQTGQAFPPSPWGGGTVDSVGVWHGNTMPPDPYELVGLSCSDGSVVNVFFWSFRAYVPGSGFTNYFSPYTDNGNISGAQGYSPMVQPFDPWSGAPQANSPFNDLLGIPPGLLGLLGIGWLPGSGGGPPPGSPCPNPPCCGRGMPVWSVSEPYISLWLYDEPLGYQPAMGSRISFKLDFNQRENSFGFGPMFFGVGKKWDCSWLSYVSQDLTTNNVVNFPDGGQRTYYTTNDYLTGTILTGDTTNGFTLTYPDGSKDVYGFIVTNSTGNFFGAFLTERWNSLAQKTRLTYFGYTNTAPVVRLQYIIDGDGRTNTIHYVTANAYSTNLISQVVDPFGRTNSLAYDANGCLTNIIDVAGNSSSIAYDTNNWATNLTTPYGTTSFTITDTTGTNVPPNGRSVLVTQPDGGHELYLYEDNAPGITNAYPSGAVPYTSPFANTLDNSDLNLRDSFHWGPRQYANLTPTNISSFTANDFRKARMQHWLLSSITVLGQTLSLERDPSPDSAGAIEGQKTWYDYAGKTNSEYEGTQVEPSFIAQVLPDGSTRFTRLLRNTQGATTNEISTYLAGSGTFRTNTYVYAANQIDLLAATNALGVQVSSNSFNAYHEVTTNYDALNEQTVYTYNANQQPTNTTLPNGLVTTYVYGVDNFVAQQINTGFATNSFTYTNDLLFTHTDARGLTTTNTWDALQRLRRVDFPNGFVTNTYSKLDLVQTVDRMGFTNTFGYDSMRRMVAETNALGAVTIYSYCTCGALNFILDAANNETQFLYDNQGNLTNTLYADAYSVTSIYNLLQQVVSTTDSGGNSVTNTYNNQGLLVIVSNALGRVQSIAYDILDRATNTVDANGVSVAATYDNLNRLLARSYPDTGVEHWGYTLNVSGATSYTNQIGNVVTYAYDAMSRKTNEVYVGVTTNGFTYDGASDLLTLTDGKSQVTTLYYDQYGNVTNKVDAASHYMFADQYDPDNRLTNRYTLAKGTTVYRYDKVGNLTNVDYSGGTVTMPSVFLAYDVLNRLTNMVTAGTFTNSYTYDAVGELLSEGGPWAKDKVTYTYANRLRMSLGLQAPSGSAWSQSYGYDTTRRLTNVTSAAGSFNYTLGGASSASPLLKTLSLPNGAYITNSYDSVARLLSTALENSSNSNLDSYAYGYNLAGQRTSVTRTLGDFVNYTYDNIGQLKTAIGKASGGTTNRWQEQLGYAYDAAGNLNFRTNNALIQNFAVNNLNELTTETNGGTLTVAGTTTAPVTNVTVNSLTANHYADATFALGGFTMTNGSNVFTAIGWDRVGNVSSNTVAVNLWATNNFAYDLNGNLTSDVLRGFDYDDENQLIRATATNSFKKEYVYDGKMRLRIRKEFSWNGGGWTETNEIHYIWDANVILQTRDSNNVPVLTFTRGRDLSGSLQGAGGIGGLLAMTESPSTLNNQPSTSFYHSDGNGNVTMLINSYQIPVAKYLYDPFGNPLADSGPKAFVNPIWFSSELYDSDTGFTHFPRRVYIPSLQRFLNRDPIEQSGGINLYEYVANNPIDLYDPLGLCYGDWWDPRSYFQEGLNGLWTYLYTGNVYASDQEYNEAVNAAGGYLIDYSPFQGGYLFGGLDLSRRNVGSGEALGLYGYDVQGGQFYGGLGAAGPGGASAGFEHIVGNPRVSPILLVDSPESSGKNGVAGLPTGVGGFATPGSNGQLEVGAYFYVKIGSVFTAGGGFYADGNKLGNLFFSDYWAGRMSSGGK